MKLIHLTGKETSRDWRALRALAILFTFVDACFIARAIDAGSVTAGIASLVLTLVIVLLGVTAWTISRQR
ncbi:MAG: hypothetical protein K8S99_01855 [Planctomycetes bacterium]|nr:hypothetical protein [Planctomycetota bacterium]